METTRAVVAVTARNLRLLRRRPDLLAQAVLVPIVLLILNALIFGAGGDDWPVAVVDKAKSERSAALTGAINESSSRITPYFRVVETDPVPATQMIENGRLQLMIEIPEDFDASGRVRISTYNINSDATKNLRLRVEDALNAYDADAGRLDLAVDLRTVRPDDIPRTGFIAGGVLLLALFFGATLLAANLFAIEQEGRTAKEILLSPAGPATAALGALISGTAAAFLTALPTYLTARFAFGLNPDPGALLLVVLFMVPVMVAGAGLGTLLAHLLRVHRSIQPLVILTGIATFFVAGGFVSVPGLPSTARNFAAWWPPSRVFEWSNPVLHGFAGSFSPTQWGWVIGVAVLGMAAAAYAGHRELGTPQRGGQ
ncbi:ABC transporter permease [Plantactinospora sp. GCM10030261]|uniref:ABC transporter permease n=1 Tax=Plantactinospora sp. GCM10030261 TaxID=3273420 RepID=UPI0036129593